MLSSSDFLKFKNVLIFQQKIQLKRKRQFWENYDLICMPQQFGKFSTTVDIEKIQVFSLNANFSGKFKQGTRLPPGFFCARQLY